MKKIVALTGAGISAESGIPTFRGANGLWEGHDITEVASPQGWAKNPKLVLDFYNQRRRAARAAEPNAAHHGLVELERQYEVVVITQNVDDLHERAGSSKVIHLHGELLKARSTAHEQTVITLEGDIHWGDTCERGAQLRPHIVWFGEMVPMMEVAQQETAQADILLVIGTSLQVYPAASLLYEVAEDIPVHIVDPHTPEYAQRPNIHPIAEAASVGVPRLVQSLLN